MNRPLPRAALGSSCPDRTALPALSTLPSRTNGSSIPRTRDFPGRRLGSWQVPDDSLSATAVDFLMAGLPDFFEAPFFAAFLSPGLQRHPHLLPSRPCATHLLDVFFNRFEAFSGLLLAIVGLWIARNATVIRVWRRMRSFFDWPGFPAPVVVRMAHRYFCISCLPPTAMIG